MNDLCFYHKADLDGKCSGAIVKYFKPSIELIPFDYDQEFPWEKITEDSIVYMIDVSLPIEDMNKLNEMCALIYIDHHISKLKDLDLSKFDGIQNDKEAACVLTWQYFYVKSVPEAVQLLGRYDIWDLDPEVLNFQYGMKLEDTDPENQIFWERLFEDYSGDFIDPIIDNGSLIRQYQEIQNEHDILEFGREIIFRDYKILALNKTHGSSLIFKDHPRYKEVDILMVFGWIGDKWKVSMYTTKDNIDVSEICKGFGGGGHKKAAAFHVKELPKDLWNAIFID
jgi:oligoribonuclease NrnB/cAMP/cGMP phosphodiesterase (DHH superfamily)